MSRNPTIKRILKESAELAAHPSPDFTASPLENDLYEWHFTLRGPPAPSPFDGGIYHGRIVLPPAYPLKPPSFRFLTPTGRFEVNREICLSISGHHEETWQPAWGIRTALVAIRSFMDSEARGQVGGMEATDEVRRRHAGNSRGWKCASCQRSNEEIMKEVEEATAGQAEEGGEDAQTVPEELRLAYREELKDGAKPEPTPTEQTPQEQQQTPQGTAPAPAPPTEPQPQSQPQPQPVPVPPPTQAVRPQQTRQTQINRLPQPRRDAEAVAPWIDKAIYGVVGALIFLVWKKFVLM